MALGVVELIPKLPAAVKLTITEPVEEATLKISEKEAGAWTLKYDEVGVVEPKPMLPAPLSVIRAYLLVKVPALATVGAEIYCPHQVATVPVAKVRPVYWP